MSKRKNHAPAFKAKVALAALSGEKPIAQLSAEHGVHQTLINKWLKQLKSEAVDIFSDAKTSKDVNSEKKLHDLHAKIGQLTVERDFLAKSCGR
jgi:transposase-like protein